MSQFMRWCLARSVSVVISLILIFASFAVCSISILPDDYSISTEPPEQVEVFNPQEWISKGVQKIQISMLKLETKVKLRYGRTRISLSINNPHSKPLQANFRIILPENAFFTIFKLKRENSAKLYTANVTRKKEARDMYKFAHVKTNGTVTAGFIELNNDRDLSSYNLKFTLGAGIHIHTYLIYERQVERKDDLYHDTVYIYPVENCMIRMFHVSVEVEEIENVTGLRCSDGTENTYTNCNRGVRRRKRSDKRAMELDWRKLNVTDNFLKNNPFRFQYELEKQNTTSAVVVNGVVEITQSNGNLFFVHLFVPQNLPIRRKHTVFLLDVSDSMHGKKLNQLKWSMTEILDDISHGDFFSIIPFSVEATVWSPFNGDMRKCPLPLPALTERHNYKEAAIHFIQSIEAHGVTNIYSGLMQAFDVIQLFSPHSRDECNQSQNINTPGRMRANSGLSPKLPENVDSMIFFLSDGVATTGIRDSKVLVELFTNLNHQNLTKPVQIHTIAYGESADEQFLRALAIQNGGVMRKITNESGAGIELANVYTEISSQVLSEIQTFASLNGTGVDPQPAQAISSNLVLVKGAEVLTAGQLFPELNQTELLRQPKGNFHWSTEASSKNGKLKYTSQVHDCRSLAHCAERIDFYLLRLQAYQLLKKLLDRDSLVREGFICPKSYEDDVVYSDSLVYYNSYYNDADDADNECVNPYKEKIIELALKEQFVTPYTALIISTEASVDIGLLGSVNYKSDPAHSEESEERQTVNGEGGTPESFYQNTPISPQHIPLITETLPVADKLVGMNGSLEVNNVTVVDDEGKNRTWLTKTIRDFVASFVKLLGGKPRVKPDMSNIPELPIDQPFR